MRSRLHTLGPWLAAWLGCVGLLYARARPTWSSTVDDAWISARYASSLAHGNGLLFSADGPRVEGFTNLLWTLLLTVGELVGAHPHGTMVGLGFVFGALAVGAVIGLARALAPEIGRYAVVPGVLLAWDPNFAVVCTNGLETSQFVATVLAALWALAADRQRWLAAALGALVLSRPDGIAIAGLIALAVLWQRRHALRDPQTWVAPGTALVTLLALEAFRLGYYGAPLPNTFEAKSSQPWDQKWRDNLRYLQPNREYLAVIGAGLLTGWLAPRRTLAKHTAALVAAAIVAIALQVFLWMPGARLLLPTVAIAYAVGASLFAPLPPRGRLALLVAVAAFPIYASTSTPLTRNARSYDARHSAQPHNGAERAARHLAAHAPAGSWLAVRDAGVFAYWVGPGVNVAEMHDRPLTQPYEGGEPVPWRERIPENPALIVATTNREKNPQSHYATDRGVLAETTAPYVYLGRVEQHYHRYYDVYARADLAIPALPKRAVVNRMGTDHWQLDPPEVDPR